MFKLFAATLLAFSTSTLHSNEIRQIEEKDFFFAPKTHLPDTSTYQVSYLLTQKQNLNQLARQNKIYALLAKALAMGPSSDTADTNPYYALITRTVYFLEQDPQRFLRNETLNNIRFLRHTLSRNDVQQLNTSLFKIPAKSFEPGYNLKQNFFQNLNSLKLEFPRLDLSLLPTTLPQHEAHFLLQESFDFSRIMGNDTTKDARTLNIYWTLDSQKILVESYTLSHLHNIPPSFLGGANKLKREYLSALNNIIKNLKTYR